MCGGLGHSVLGRSSGCFKDICQLEHVCPAVEVAVVSKREAPEGLPDLLRMGAVLVTDMRISELVVEGLLWGELGLGEAIPGVHVLVRVHTIPH